MPPIQRQALQFLRLEQILDPQPLIVSPQMSASAVIEQMCQIAGQDCQLDAHSAELPLDSYAASCALVVDDQLRGIFTERDVVKLLAAGMDLETVAISKVMTQPVITLEQARAENPFTVLSTLKQHRIRQLPIVDQGQNILGLVTQTTIRRAMQPFNFLKFRRVRDVMMSQVVQAGPSTTLSELTLLMAQNRVSCVVITERSRPSAPAQPVGILTERDMLQFRALGLSLANTPARTVMSTPLFLVHPGDSLWTVYQQMQQRHVRRLVAEREGELAGIVTQTSLLQVLDPIEMLEEINHLQQISEAQTASLNRTNQHLQQTNRRLQDEILERQRLEVALQEANRILEERVGIQAARLVQANEALLRASRERQQFQRQLEQFFAVTPSLLCIAGLDGYFKQLNTSFEEALGYGLSELLSIPFIEFVHPQDRAATTAEIERLAQGELTIAFENRYRTKDGSYRWLSWNATATPEEGVIYAAARDVTEHKQAHLAIARQSQQKQILSEIIRKVRESLAIDTILQTTVIEVQRLLHCSHVLIVACTTASEGTVLQESTAPNSPSVVPLGIGTTLALRGEPATNCISATPATACIFDTAAVTAQYPDWSCIEVPVYLNTQLWGLIIVGQCDSQRRWDTFELELMQQLANHIGVAISHTQLLNNLEAQVAHRTHQLTAANHQLQREVEEQLRIDAARRRSEQALLRSEERLRLTTDALPALIGYVDTNQRYCFNNKTYEVWFNLPRAELQGRHIREVLGEDYYGQILPYVEAVLQGQPCQFEASLPMAGGRVRYVIATYIPEVDPEGEVMGFFAMVNDISDRKATERMKDEFVSVVGHELKTPLTSIHGSLKLLVSDRLGPLSPQAHEFVNIALRNTERLSRLVADVLDLERIESGQMIMAMQPCNLDNLMQQAVNTMATVADKRGVQIHLTGPNGNRPNRSQSDTAQPSLIVWADPDPILQVLTNLIDNALKFSAAGSAIQVGATRRQSDALVQIADRGRGIPTDKLEAIFERFQQVDASDSRQLGGTGLGLTISRDIVQRHGGTIWVESALGEGSTFYFTLPTVE
ncbi:MAG: CBS domain-containing protein [Cyanobacteria bacterium P01_A01_bin.135]